MVDVISAEALGEYNLRLSFSDGCEGVFDASDLIAGGGEMVEPLRSPDFFSRVNVENGAPRWSNGFDLDSNKLHLDLGRAGALVKNGWHILPARGGGVVTSEMVEELLERADLEDAGLVDEE